MMNKQVATVSHNLPREMTDESYRIMYDVEYSHWWFRGRRRVIETFVAQAIANLDLQDGRAARILDIGCGTGANLELLGRFGDAEGLDISEDALEFCRARGFRNVRRGAAEKLPYRDAEFDMATALDVVEHLDDDLLGLREMNRVLRAGGKIVLFVPAFMFLWGVQDVVSRHRRRYRLPELCARVREADFTIERATYANFFLFAPILAGRFLIRASGAKPASENNVNVPQLNGALARLFGAESRWLRHANFPFGVSAICVARKN